MSRIWDGLRAVGRGALAVRDVHRALSTGKKIEVRAPSSWRNPLLSATDEIRCDHTVLMGAPGSGKTSLMQELWMHDFKRAKAGDMSSIVIDSSDLIDDLIAHARLERLDNVVLIDPADPTSMPRLNLFASSIRGNAMVETANFIGTFVGVCTGLLDTELTLPMRTLFTASAQMMMQVERPTLWTLLQLFQDPAVFLERYGGDAPPRATQFFLDQVINAKKGGGMTATVGALGSRIYGITMNPIMDRLLVNEEPSVDIAHRINEGAIVLVATRKAQLSSEGCKLLGKFVISMTRRAVMERQPIPRPERKFTCLMIDEFQNYLAGGRDPELCELMDQDARKNAVALLLACQRPGQLHKDMGDAIESSTGTKIMGRLNNPTFVERMAKSMRADKDELGALNKGEFMMSVTDPSKRRAATVVHKIWSKPGCLSKLGKRDAKALSKLREKMAAEHGGGEATKIEAPVGAEALEAL